MKDPTDTRTATLPEVALEIQAQVPIPPRGAGRGTRAPKYPILRLEPGQSFFVPESPERSRAAIRASLCSLISRAKNANPGLDYATRYWKDERGTNGVRVWRVA